MAPITDCTPQHRSKKLGNNERQLKAAIDSRRHLRLST